MSDLAALQGAFAGVIDPLLARPLADLSMIRSTKMKRRGGATLTAALPVPNYRPTAELEARLRAAAASVGVAGDITIDYELMNDDEREALMASLRPDRAMPGAGTRVIAVASGKGGVGKSSVTTNLAVALGGMGHSVGVIDADVWGYSIPKMLGIAHEPVVIAESIVPPIAHGVKAMSMDYFVSDDQAVVWRGPMLHKALEQFLVDVFWDEPEFLLLDMPPGTGDVAISVSQFIPRAQVILVTTPQPTAQRVAKRAALMADKVNQDVLGVVENMSWFTGDDGKRYELFGSGGGAELAEDLDKPLLAQVPFQPLLRSGADVGQPIAVSDPGSEAHQAFADLADEVVARKPRIRTHPELVIK